jgi:signal-transduction protein with cAMP-binding, CBS, and nucleotidyltransferase domain/PAS domain-containing protein
MMESKKEMISELTNTAWSLVDEFYNEFQLGRITLEEAKQQAAFRVGKMRYGDEEKDYFWITDMRPYMVMHPYRQELNKTDLSDYHDSEGKKLFVDAVQIVKNNSEGYIDYMWQWKDDTTQVVPKLSYVKAFVEWKWIIGTGIYLEDVQKEISNLEKRLFRIVFLIVLVIALVLLYIVRQSMKLENSRRAAEKNLQLSRLKYKTLVESSTIGTLMLKSNRIVYANQKFVDLVGISHKDLLEKGIEELFGLDWKSMVDSFSDPDKSLNFETKIEVAENNNEVMLSVSKVKYDTNFSYIIVVTELAKTEVIKKYERQVEVELKTALLLMNQPIKNLLSDYLSCDTSTSVEEAINLLNRKAESTLFIRQNKVIIGVVSTSDLIQRSQLNKVGLSASIATVMTSPVVTIHKDCLLSEALFVCRSKQISSLVVLNLLGNQIGVVNYKSLLQSQYNYISNYYSEIGNAVSVNSLKNTYRKLVVVVDLLMASGAKPNHLTEFISTVADKITVKTIDLAIETEGTPPCEFCFIAMGSQGRKEQTLTTDQDNGIIIANAIDKKNGSQEYFLNLGKKINDSLHTIGYNYCNGNFMAGNPEWNLSLQQWKKLFSSWVKSSDSQSLIDMNIFFDFRPVYGNKSLADELRLHLNTVTKNKGVFFYQLSQEIHRFKSPIGMFGKIQGEHETSNSNKIDIKKLIMPVTSFSRLYALLASILDTNTVNRYNSLRTSEDINSEMIADILGAYEMLMDIRLKAQLIGIHSGEGPSNIFDINQLTSIEQASIKKALSVIADIITKVKLDFRSV